MRKHFFFAMLFGMAPCLWAQTGSEADESDDKLSVTTQMFLQEQAGEINFDPQPQSTKRPGRKPAVSPNRRHGKNNNRLYASPDTIDGKAYIAAYLRLNNPSDKSEVEAVGVILQEEFNNGLFTSLIPVDQLEKVAGISNVNHINVSPLKHPTTYTARQLTHVDELLTPVEGAYSWLTHKYDGTGVVLGVIDTGFDFQHITFKDANGNYRMKRAYVYSGVSGSDEEFTTFGNLTTDDKSQDHGTHTASTAGGSSVIVNGTNVTVTDNHANATYGGMAPGADLYLAGVKGLASTYLDNAVKKIVSYADAQGQPVVVSNSWGSQLGPHDGTGDVADVYNTMFGDAYPNHIALFASSNDGARPKDNEGGGFHVSATASSSNPLRTIVRSSYYSNTDAGYHYEEIIANAWFRSKVTDITCKIYVLDSSTGAIKTTATVTLSTRSATVKGLSEYYSGSLTVYKNYISAANKTQVMLYASNMETTAETETTKDGETYYKSKYTLALELAPSRGSAMIDVWSGDYNYFTDYLTTNGYTWIAGSDDMSVSDEATMPNVISIGAYVSDNSWTDSNGDSRIIPSYTVGDIAYFSSYAIAEKSPTGLQYPWITAPGARLAAAVNHLHTASVDENSYYGNNFFTDLVVNSTNYPYAMMEGTSMATPTAAGIVALWLQAAKEIGRKLTVNDVKEIMQATAINDDFTTTGPNASHFGNGKIDALAGIRYILTGKLSDPINVTLADASNNSETINETLNDNADKLAIVTLSNRVLYKDDCWNTLCLPFDIDDFTDTPLEGATVKTLEDASYDSDTYTMSLTFSESSLTSIEAGKPYIVKWAPGTDIENPVFNDVSLSEASPTEKAVTIDGVVSFKGTYDPISFDANDTKKLYLASNNTLYYPNSAMTVNAFRCWFELEGNLKAGDPTTGNLVNSFQLNFGGNSTGITTIQSSDNEVRSRGWYMLDGRRLNEKPATKGIYIHNGKKVVVK